MQVALPMLAKQDFGGAAAFGWIMSGVAGGSILAALALAGLSLRSVQELS